MAYGRLTLYWNTQNPDANTTKEEFDVDHFRVEGGIMYFKRGEIHCGIGLNSGQLRSYELYEYRRY
jgi:hypothetical protein